MKFTVTTKNEMHAKRLTKATDMAIVLWEIRHNLKKHCEYRLQEKTPDATYYDALDMVFDEINELCDLHGVLTNDLIE